MASDVPCKINLLIICIYRFILRFPKWDRTQFMECKQRRCSLCTMKRIVSPVCSSRSDENVPIIEAWQSFLTMMMLTTSGERSNPLIIGILAESCLRIPPKAIDHLETCSARNPQFRQHIPDNQEMFGYAKKCVAWLAVNFWPYPNRIPNYRRLKRFANPNSTSLTGLGCFGFPFAHAAPVWVPSVCRSPNLFNAIGRASVRTSARTRTEQKEQDRSIAERDANMISQWRLHSVQLLNQFLAAAAATTYQLCYFPRLMLWSVWTGFRLRKIKPPPKFGLFEFHRNPSRWKLAVDTFGYQYCFDDFGIFLTDRDMVGFPPEFDHRKFTQRFFFLNYLDHL